MSASSRASTSNAKSQKPRISSRICKKLHETIAVSPVTIVVGPTGCGKSTQVPPALLLDPSLNGGPILCTQPRRLAVVAVATRVAQEQGVVLGGADVGYHVGQSNHSLSTTKLIFSTAGILLEELRAHGVTALTKYKVVVIDECHERSPESDLVLAIIRSLLLAHPHKQIRIVLMSATFDHARYQRYFDEVPGCGHIDTISLETASSFESYYDRVQTFYLEDAIDMVPESDTFGVLRRTMRQNPNQELAGPDNGKTLSDEMLRLIRLLVVQMHQQEPMEGVFVIFAPTYRHLEQIYYMLRYQTVMDRWKLDVLHSSIDIEYCLDTMKAGGTKTRSYRKILLASAIADSSVTIPGVTCIIDLCRALEVKWDPSKMSRIPKTVWASRSICEQRRGRTGRTCPGIVFRLVSKRHYIASFKSWEVPQLTISPCRDEVLKLLCAGVVKDVSGLLEQCLDPPPPDVVKQALQYLQRVGACIEGPKNRMIPTKGGELMAALPFQVETSRIVLAGAKKGLLYETLALCAIKSHKPAPIVHHFGDTERNADSAINYYPDAENNDPMSTSIANLSAFLYWDAVWNGSRQKATVEQFTRATGSRRIVDQSMADGFSNESADSRKACCNVWKLTPQLEEKHAKWCEENSVNPTSVRGITELMDSTLGIFYTAKYEPEWLRSAHPTPKWRRNDTWERSGSCNDCDMMSRVYGWEKHRYLIATLKALWSNQNDSASQHLLNFTGQQAATRRVPQRANLPVACVHFLQGNCTYGEKCRNSHSASAIPPPCRFFESGRCTKGDSCVYSHGRESSNTDQLVPADSLQTQVPILPSLLLTGGSMQWFADHREKLLLMGEGQFEFTRSLIKLRLCPSFSSEIDTDLDVIGAAEVLRVDASRIHQHRDVRALVGMGAIENFAWNFPFTGIEEDDTVHESLILGTFLSLNQLLISDGLHGQDYRMALTLQGDQFSRWMVLRSAFRTGWHLANWGNFKSADYPGYSPRRANGDEFPSACSRFYVFIRQVQ